jgi:hypothetical protein
LNSSSPVQLDLNGSLNWNFNDWINMNAVTR